MKEFARCGFAGTSAESIAEAAGFSGGAFYSNYRSKQSILVDVMRTLQAEESEAWQRIISEGRSVEEIVEQLAERGERFARQEDWLLLKLELELRAARNEEFRQEYAAYRTELRQLARAMLDSLYRRAGGRTPGNVEVLVDSWLAFSTGIGLYYLGEQQATLRETVRKTVVIPFFLSLLAQAEPASSSPP
ncbi:MAG: TetR/AcrR family transcriptional regulator [Rhodocyclaceae bacterium]|jgi:AcrR family transcriptional regulator|nr:TetR/AcrR family transcriptional regulator [Rhodocyclaceae bacterium]